MIFLSPWMLALLALIPILWKLTARGRRLQHETATLLRGGGVVDGATRPPLPRGDRLLLMALVCLILALARPAWNPHSESNDSGGRDLVIALDISRSMLASDVFPSRLEAARIAILESLPALRGHRIALITFAGAATVRVPLTLDHGFVRYMLERADPADVDVGGTSLQAVIEKAIDTVFTGADKAGRDMIIFTDGEDHISNIAKTAKELHDCRARVLIVGLGDPISGARIPSLDGKSRWMQYRGADVVTRLDEATLARLAKGSPAVTYFQAGIRPFDLMALYRKMTLGEAARSASGGGGIVYTEGYPLLIAAALLLLSAWRFPALLGRVPVPILTALMISGCGHGPSRGDAEFRDHERHGGKLRDSADSTSAGDPVGLQEILVGAREEFLRAAMFKPGDPGAAREISALTARIHLLDEEIRKKKEEEEKQREELAAAIERLKGLTAREAQLAQQSQQLLRQRPPMPPDQLLAAVPPKRDEQSGVKEGTSGVLDTVAFHQQLVRKILARAYGEKPVPPPNRVR